MSLLDELGKELSDAEEALDRETSHHMSLVEKLADSQTVLDGLRATVRRLTKARSALLDEEVAEPEPVEQAAPPKRKKARPDPDNPYANYECTSCGTKGSTYPTQVGAASHNGGDNGKRIPALVCGSCGKQTIGAV